MVKKERCVHLDLNICVKEGQNNLCPVNIRGESISIAFPWRVNNFCGIGRNVFENVRGGGFCP